MCPENMLCTCQHWLVSFHSCLDKVLRRKGQVSHISQSQDWIAINASAKPSKSFTQGHLSSAWFGHMTSQRDPLLLLPLHPQHVLKPRRTLFHSKWHIALWFFGKKTFTEGVPVWTFYRVSCLEVSKVLVAKANRMLSSDKLKEEIMFCVTRDWWVVVHCWQNSAKVDIERDAISFLWFA